MKKKYQVFISSTYNDLIEERAAVTQCLLKMDCIPVGMEQFPASDMSQMDYIKMMLDDCDYYVLILAGRYGSLDSDGVGFTEKEYNYAKEKGIPIMSFVTQDIGKLTSEKCEKNDEYRRKLEDFRQKVCKDKLVNFYTNCESLQAAVVTSLHKCIKYYPATGWVRGNSVEKPVDIEAKIEQYMQEHTISKGDIEALFAEDTNILDGGNANSHNTKSSSDTITLAGARTLVEEVAKKMPKVKWGEF